mmetsp:Transcript_26994/g.64820  ORF Transcript_26994/g.64820 Transcript_26994/m.64820 type:complete len:208 (+) Transcript_26994:263-886(+)
MDGPRAPAGNRHPPNHRRTDGLLPIGPAEEEAGRRATAGSRWPTLMTTSGAGTGGGASSSGPSRDGDRRPPRRRRTHGPPLPRKIRATDGTGRGGNHRVLSPPAARPAPGEAASPASPARTPSPPRVPPPREARAAPREARAPSPAAQALLRTGRPPPPSARYPPVLPRLVPRVVQLLVPRRARIASGTSTTTRSGALGSTTQTAGS